MWVATPIADELLGAVVVAVASNFLPRMHYADVGVVAAAMPTDWTERAAVLAPCQRAIQTTPEPRYIQSQ